MRRRISFELAYRDGLDVDSRALAALDDMPRVEIGHVDDLGRHVFADGSPVGRLTPERLEDLECQWFGRPWPLPTPSVPRKPLGSRACVCAQCGKSFTIKESEYKHRMSTTTTGNVFCSRRCVPEFFRKQKQEGAVA